GHVQTHRQRTGFMVPGCAPPHGERCVARDESRASGCIQSLRRRIRADCRDCRSRVTVCWTQMRAERRAPWVGVGFALVLVRALLMLMRVFVECVFRSLADTAAVVKMHADRE